MKLALETISTCNRYCRNCLRNSYPDREKLEPWFEPALMPMVIINKALEQYSELGFSTVCLSHYNEPLMDDRISTIARIAKSYGLFVYLNSNGDLLRQSPQKAKSLDGVLDRIKISFRKKSFDLESLFKKTELVYTESEHIPTHFSPDYNVRKLAEQNRGNPCLEPARRIIINHQQKFLLCCDDLVGEFFLGTFPETSIEKFLLSRLQIVMRLEKPNGRNFYPYCFTCPRP